MKHPALTRLLSVLLAALCVTMLLAGLGSIAGAMRGRDSAMADYGRLTGRIEEYEQILSELDGQISYREANLAFTEQREQHDEQATQHRMDLAIYTATRGGLQAGSAALDEAEEAFAKGVAQYYAGIALFEEQEKAFWEGYDQFQAGKQQMAEARKTLELAQTALSALRGQLEQSRALAAILESEDENARRELTVTAYDSLLQSLDQAVGLYEQLKERGGISAEELQQLTEMLAQQSDANLAELLDGIEWQDISAETLTELENSIVEATGMTIPEIRAQIQQQRDAAADMDADEPISEEQFALLQAGYQQSRALLQAVDEAMEQKLSEYEEKLGEAQAQMDAAQAQMDALDAVMEQGKTMMEQARAALDMAGGQIWMGQQGLADGRRQIEEQNEELARQEEELRREKDELDAEAAVLEEESDALEQQRQLEQRETSLRLLLLEREGIQKRVDDGMELLPAAKDCAEALLQDTERMTKGRLWVSGLMIFGAICGFAGIPAAFEKTGKRFWLLAPPILCLGCALGAELICRDLGRGDSYSALAVAVFALLLLCVAAPRKKKI